ncbi:malonyl-CoA/methylmalonyl-CoA synthetase [Novosphingobium sp. CF614]|uniref:AMP-binding protein n=1 Tax=Novosphingobium sp. CF614 TaxID=1884364 RepID=UPI0008E9451A|nr:AMP-binding protein [Novosphingobium sp. CF614]SFG14542.1 malonyl-CoA/methylmalonyl-CoA synthetase [Novosphingobium sp. CF614]
MPGDLYSRFVQSFERFANRILVEDGARAWTYGEIGRLAGRLAARLQALGVAPGERVLVQTDKNVETLILYFATIRAGAIYLPLNIDYTEAELDYFAADATPVLAVCRESSAEVFGRIGGGGMQVSTLAALFADLPEAEAPPVPRASDDVAAILYTSGTTGKPKGAMLSQDNLASNGEMLIEFWRFTPEDRLIHALPIFHVHGLFVAVHCVLFSGASMVFLPRFESARVIELMAKSTVLMGVPTYYVRLLADPAFTRESAGHMRLFISGSAPLSADIHRAFEERCGHRVLERYGMTETGMLTSNPYDGERRAGFVGPPLPGVGLRIAEFETGRVLPQGEVGIVEVAGRNIFKGYWQMPEKTASEFRPDGWFITGDMGVIDARGYVQLVGREKDLIISGGLNVYPAEVEALLDDRPDVAEAAVIGVPHPDFGEAVVAVVQPAGPFDPEAVREAMRKELAAFKVPKAIFTMDALPRNTMGKIQKKLLREQYAGLFAPA